MTPVTDPALLAELEKATTGGLPPYDPSSPLRRPAEFASGFNKGLAGLLGMPVDAASWGLRKVGVDIPAAPVGGSDYLTQKLADAGMIGATTDRTGRMIERVGQEVGATAVPTGGLLAAAKRAQPVLTPARGLLTQMIQGTKAAPGTVAATDAGLAVTSGLGAATAREIDPGNPTAELIGQLAGGFGPAALTAGTRAVFRGGEAGRRALEQNLDTFTRAGVDPTVGQATGRASMQGVENVLGKAPGSVGVMARKAQETSEQLARRATQIADSYAKGADVERAGRTIERGIEGFVKHFQVKANALYGILDNFIQPTTRVTVKQTANTLKQLNAPIEGAENISGVLANPKLGQFADAFAVDAADGTLPYEAVKDLRSQVGRMLSSPELVTNAPKADLKRLYAALSQDMEGAAAAAGPKAVNALSRANTFYRAGLERIEGSLQKIASRATPEDMFKAATRGKEGATTIRRVRRSLNPEEWDIVASTVLRRLGQARPGMQNAAGDVFSPETFLTSWNSLAPEARGAIFGGTRYKQMARDLDAVAETAAHLRQSSRVLANPSGTSGQAINTGAMWTAGYGALTGNWELPVLVGSLSAVSNGGARLMTNPKFVRWLAQGTRMQAQQLPGHIGRLTQVLRDEDADTKNAAREYLNAMAEAGG